MLTALLLAKFATAAPTMIKVAELVNQPTIPTPTEPAPQPAPVNMIPKFPKPY